MTLLKGTLYTRQPRPFQRFSNCCLMVCVHHSALSYICMVVYCFVIALLCFWCYVLILGRPDLSSFVVCCVGVCIYSCVWSVVFVWVLVDELFGLFGIIFAFDHSFYLPLFTAKSLDFFNAFVWDQFLMDGNDVEKKWLMLLGKWHKISKKK